jgi:hypothetical protein
VETYTVQQGDCLSSIALRFGFAGWKPIFEHPDNAEFRQRRPDPNIIYPGDILRIPDRRQKQVSAGTEKKHSFRLKRPQTYLRLVVRDERGRPFKEQKYRLIVGKVLNETGQTAADGRLEHPIPPDAEQAVLTLWVKRDNRQREYRWVLNLGHLDPIDEISGTQARLSNLGFDCGKVDGTLGPRTEAAIRGFQEKFGLETDGVAGPVTKDKLEEIYSARGGDSAERNMPVTHGDLWEAMPEEVGVDLAFYDDGTLSTCDAPRGSWPPAWGGKLTTALAGRPTNPAHAARSRIDADVLNTLAVAHPTIALLDCGRWGDRPRQRNFGLVWGRYVALCEFRSTPGPIPVIDRNAKPLNDLVASLCQKGCSISKIKSVCSPAPMEPDWNPIYVILGDLHLPIVNKLSTMVKQESRGEVNGRAASGHTVADPESRMGRHEFFPEKIESVSTWYDRYFAGDIFGDAGADLALFAGLLGVSPPPLRDRIHFVQAGDMYDLWIGLDRFFSGNSDNLVVLEDAQDVQATKFVDHWIAETAKVNGPAINALNSMAVHQRTWLWGNHDNYLAEYTPPRVPSRRREVRRGGIFIEHGHRCDTSNMDGATRGHTVTNAVFTSPVLRSFDPNRRSLYLVNAAYDYLKSPDFAVYAMGHTHSPYLTRMRIDVSRVQPRAQSSQMDR